MSTSSRITACLVAGLVLAPLSVGVLTTTPAEASIASIGHTARAHGAKMGSGLWLGSYRVKLSGGAKHLAYTHGKKTAPNGEVATVITRPPGVPAANSAKVKWLVNNFGKTAKATHAEAVRLVLGQLTNDPTVVGHLNAYYKHLGKSRGATVKALVAHIRSDLGCLGTPKVKVTAAKLLPGQKGVGHVTVTCGGQSGFGYHLSSFAASGAKVSSHAAWTGTSGQLSFSYRRAASFAKVSLGPKVFSASASKVTVNFPYGKGARALLAYAHGSSVAASYSYQLLPPLTVKTVYASKPKGTGQATLTTAESASASPIREKLSVGGKQVATCVSTASGTCSATLTEPDTTKVAVKACARSGSGCNGPWVSLGTREVVAPAWAQCRLIRRSGYAPVVACKVAAGSKRHYVLWASYGAHHKRVKLAVGQTTRLSLGGYHRSLVLRVSWSVYRHAGRVGKLMNHVFINRRLH